MAYTSFSAFTWAIRQSVRTAVGRLPPAGAWLCFLLGGLFLYTTLSRLTPIVLLGQQADGVVVSLRHVSGRHAHVLPTVRYTLPDGQTATFETASLLGRHFTVGEQLRIRYLPWWPERAEIFSFGQLFSPLIITWIGAYIFFAGGMAVIRARKQRIIDQQNLDAFMASQAERR